MAVKVTAITIGVEVAIVLVFIGLTACCPGDQRINRYSPSRANSLGIVQDSPRPVM